MKYFPLLIVLVEILILAYSIKIIESLQLTSGIVEKVEISKYRSSIVTYDFNLKNNNNIYSVRSGWTVNSWLSEIPKANEKVFFFTCTNSYFIDENDAIATSTKYPVSRTKLWYHAYSILVQSLWMMFIAIAFGIVLFKLTQNEVFHPLYFIIYVFFKVLIFMLT